LWYVFVFVFFPLVLGVLELVGHGVCIFFLSFFSSSSLLSCVPELCSWVALCAAVLIIPARD
jgi:hypothetical protein